MNLILCKLYLNKADFFPPLAAKESEVYTCIPGKASLSYISE